MTTSDAITGRPIGRPTNQGPLTAHVRARLHPQDEETSYSERSSPPRAGFARELGWFSIGLGLSQVLAPRGVARLIGVPCDGPTTALMRLIGLRELACGAGLLSGGRPSGWAWARFAGDVMDLALLGSAMASDRSRPGRTAAATAAVVGVAALDLYQAVESEPVRHMLHNLGWNLGEVYVRKAITVNKPVDEVYRFWRDLTNLPRFMYHLESVHVEDDRRSHWRTKAPAGMSVEWDAEIVEDRPDERIAWRSVEGSQVDNEGSVRFVRAPGGHGTEVHVELRYSPPGGAVGAAIAWLFGESADQQIYDDLRAFKQVIETGEVTVSEGTLGHRAFWQRPAQPPEALPADWPGLED